MHFIAFKVHMANTAGRSKLGSKVRQITKINVHIPQLSLLF